MFYFIADRDYVIIIPTIAVSLDAEFWIEIDWLNFSAGWRTGDGGHGEDEQVEGKLV